MIGAIGSSLGRHFLLVPWTHWSRNRCRWLLARSIARTIQTAVHGFDAVRFHLGSKGLQLAMSSPSRLLDFLGNQSRQDKSFGGSPRRLLSYSAVWSGTLSSLAVRRISYWVGSRRRRHTLSAGCAHLSKLYWSIHWVSPKVSHLFFQEWSWWRPGGKWTSCMTQYSPVPSNQSGL